MPSQWTPYSLSCCAESRKGNIVKNAEQMDKLVVEKMGADELMEVDSAFMMLAIYNHQCSQIKNTWLAANFTMEDCDWSNLCQMISSQFNWLETPEHETEFSNSAN